MNILRWLAILPMFGIVRNIAMIFIYYFFDLNRLPQFVLQLLEYPLHGAAAFVATFASVLLAPSKRMIVAYIISALSIIGNVLIMLNPEVVNAKYNVHAAGIASIIGHIIFLVYFYRVKNDYK